MTDSTNEILKRCGYCEGKGETSEDGFGGGDIITCPVCQGAGQIIVETDTELHQICDGSGKIKLRGPMGKEMVMCPDCHGTGWFK
jgi:DnaJ-class molecular chaperone